MLYSYPSHKGWPQGQFLQGGHPELPAPFTEPAQLLPFSGLTFLSAPTKQTPSLTLFTPQKAACCPLHFLPAWIIVCISERESCLHLSPYQTANSSKVETVSYTSFSAVFGI